MTKISDELKPCPFCGSDDLMVLDVEPTGQMSEYSHVICCDCNSAGPMKMSDDQADEAWNLRAHNSDSAEPVGYIRPETLHKLREGDAGPVVGVAAYDTTIPLYLASPPAKEVENRIKELEDALRPFAKCSELYPNAKGRGNTGFAGLHDARCTVTFDDYHRAHAALTNRTPDDEVGNG